MAAAPGGVPMQPNAGIQAPSARANVNSARGSARGVGSARGGNRLGDQSAYAQKMW